MAMKVNKYGIICALALLSGVVGCEDSSSLLDKEESNDIYENMVFSDPYNATWFLSNIYKSNNSKFNFSRDFHTNPPFLQYIQYISTY
jgi:hypothetical protein